jgi:hypothetical protein
VTPAVSLSVEDAHYSGASVNGAPIHLDLPPDGSAVLPGDSLKVTRSAEGVRARIVRAESHPGEPSAHAQPTSPREQHITALRNMLHDDWASVLSDREFAAILWALAELERSKLPDGVSFTWMPGTSPEEQQRALAGLADGIRAHREAQPAPKLPPRLTIDFGEDASSTSVRRALRTFIDALDDELDAEQPAALADLPPATDVAGEVFAWASAEPPPEARRLAAIIDRERRAAFEAGQRGSLVKVSALGPSTATPSGVYDEIRAVQVPATPKEVTQLLEEITSNSVYVMTRTELLDVAALTIALLNSAPAPQKDGEK